MSSRVCTRWDQRLHTAASRGDLQEIRRVLDSGRVHVDCTDRDGTTPLVLAAANGHVECVKELLEQGADPTARRYTGTGALFFAAQGGYTDILVMMLEAGVHVDLPSKDGGTALIVSSQCGHCDVVQLLLDRGADPHTAMRDRATALFVAAQNGHTPVVRCLLRGGSRIDCRRSDGASPLWIAAQMGHACVVRELLGHGAQPDTPRRDGATALFKAAHKGHVEVVKALLLHRPRLGLLKNGESALHAAALYGHLEVVRLLVRAGADPGLRNDQGLTPAHIALRAGHQLTARFLQQSAPAPKRSPHSPRSSPGSLSRGSSQPGSLETIVEASPPPQRANNFQSCELTAVMDGEARSKGVDYTTCASQSASLTASNASLTAPSPSPSVVSEPPALSTPCRSFPHHRTTSHSDLRSMKSLFCKTFSSFRRASLGKKAIQGPP